jgi:hypothetical protein
MIVIAIKQGIFSALWSMFLIAPPIFAQAAGPANDCSDPAAVWIRYIDALGGQQAVDSLETRVAEARETAPSSFNPAATNTYDYRFEWKSPNKAVVRSTHVVSMFGLPVPFAKTHFIFDGEHWSDFQGKPVPQREARPGRPRREFPTTFEAMWRVTADPLLFAHSSEFYSEFAPANDFGAYPDRCILEAHGKDGRVDFLYFDRAAGFLRAWSLDVSTPRSSHHIIFFFDDYRQAGEVMFPFYIYSDFYKATFRYSKVVHNRPLPDSHFVIRQ